MNTRILSFRGMRIYGCEKRDAFGEVAELYPAALQVCAFRRAGRYAVRKAPTPQRCGRGGCSRGGIPLERTTRTVLPKLFRCARVSEP